MSPRFQFGFKKWMALAVFITIPVGVLLADRLNSRQKGGAIATWLLIGVVELVKYLKSK